MHMLTAIYNRVPCFLPGHRSTNVQTDEPAEAPTLQVNVGSCKFSTVHLSATLCGYRCGCISTVQLSATQFEYIYGEVTRAYFLECLTTIDVDVNHRRSPYLQRDGR